MENSLHVRDSNDVQVDEKRAVVAWLLQNPSRTYKDAIRTFNLTITRPETIGKWKRQVIENLPMSSSQKKHPPLIPKTHKQIARRIPSLNPDQPQLSTKEYNSEMAKLANLAAKDRNAIVDGEELRNPNDRTFRNYRKKFDHTQV